MNKIYYKSETSKSPLSAAIQAGDTLYVSGQLGIKPGTNELAGAEAEKQMEQAMNNLEAILKEASMSFRNIVKTMVFVADKTDVPIINNIYMKYFDNNYPTRSCVQVSFPRDGVKVEIEAIAIK